MRWLGRIETKGEWRWHYSSSLRCGHFVDLVTWEKRRRGVGAAILTGVTNRQMEMDG